MQPLNLAAIDYAILIIYLAFVIGIGWALRRFVKDSDDFFLSGRSIPAWITSLAFISANLGAQEVIGMGASGAKYGMMTSHFYWVGAIPAMVFVGVFMMPFYYGSRARSVPEYLKLRFDEKTRGLNAITFAVMTVFSSGISMYALAKLLELTIGWSFHASILLSAVIVLAYIWAGLTEVAAIVAIAINKLPTAVVTLREGARALDAALDEMATVFALPRWKKFRHVILPQLSPYIAAAARSGLSLVWKIVLVAELLGRPNGVGFEIGVAFQLFDIPRLLAYSLSFAAVVLLIETLLVQPFEARLSRWRPRAA